MRLGILTTHPIQYQVPLFRALATTPGVDLEVLFCSDHGLRPDFDSGFGKTVQFDVPLLGGYAHRFLPNRAPNPGVRFAGLVNPEVLDIIARRHYDALVVHGYATVSSLMALLARRRRGGTRILFRGESHLREHRSLTRRVVKQGLLRALFGRVDQFLPIGTLNREYLRSFGVGDERMTLAPYSVDNAYFRSRSETARRDRRAARQALGIPADGVLFLFCAKLSEVKRPFDALRAFAIANTREPCHLAFAGSGVLEPSLRNLASELGVAERVHFLGFRNQSELPGIYGMADALVLPSGKEPWGLVVNEAMACGTAIVASDSVGSTVDLVRDNGVVFRSGDVERLASILTDLASAPDRLRAMGDASRRIIDTWGIDQTAEGFLAATRASLRSEHHADTRTHEQP